MKIVCISDIHGMHNKITLPDGDMLIVAGDFTDTGKPNQLRAFAHWMGKQPHQHKVVVAGNHDQLFEENRHRALQNMRLECDFHYLQDQSVEIGGLQFYGSPWQPEFCGWAFNLPRGESLARKWKEIPNNTEVLITHGPPWGILDTNKNDERCGCEDLARRLDDLPYLKLHVFGHIHGGAGKYVDASTTFINASVCTEDYAPTNPIQVIEI